VNGRNNIRAGALVAIVAIAAVLVWSLAGCGGGGGSSAVAPTGTKPVEVSQAELSALADKLGQPVYWAGVQPDTKLELTQTKDGRIYVRYLPTNAKIGDPKGKFLTVGTYPFKDAYSSLVALSNEGGSTVEHVGDSGLAVAEQSAPTSVYFAQQDEDFQIEVYDPDAAQALDLVTSGAVQPVD
jgi:hypothetical protein